MAGGVNRKISAASARAHTRRAKQNTSFQLPSGMFKKALALLFVGVLAWGYQATRPPPPKICGSPEGPAVTAPRIELSDGRHLAYIEHGVQKDSAKHKIVFVHGFDSCRHDTFAKYVSPEIVEDLGLYIVAFDRPGYGESDPNPKLTVKSMALDIEELADQLGLGSKFYVVGFSLGGQLLWSVLKYSPHRIAGVALIAPVVNYWWTGFPENLSKEAYNQQLWNDQWALRVAHYTPWLTYWWNTQKWFPYLSAIAHSPAILSSQDKELVMLPKRQARQTYMAQVRQQGEFESIHRDIIVAFGKWEFSPLELENPFPNNEGSVHVWHGDDDLLVPVSLQRYIAQQLPWIHYHELPGAGHLFPEAEGKCDTIIKKLLVGEEVSSI
ncbi:Alpha/beta hydrolase fold [Parasponia andersonii]|uniref:Alpha/beta hydrolase fold n=1 Tax=Parasponia andersonii TaxID=3476 RepID=A0A2P5B0W6_PARAD|nr:Alpha/beta hydrolase fold [Parasponia andersonii]